MVGVSKSAMGIDEVLDHMIGPVGLSEDLYW